MALPDKRTHQALPGLPSWAVNLWIASIVLTFLFIRVLGSGTAQRLLNRFGLWHHG